MRHDLTIWLPGRRDLGSTTGTKSARCKRHGIWVDEAHQHLPVDEGLFEELGLTLRLFDIIVPQKSRKDQATGSRQELFTEDIAVVPAGCCAKEHDSKESLCAADGIILCKWKLHLKSIASFALHLHTSLCHVGKGVGQMSGCHGLYGVVDGGRCLVDAADCGTERIKGRIEARKTAAYFLEVVLYQKRLDVVERSGRRRRARQSVEVEQERPREPGAVAGSVLKKRLGFLDVHVDAVHRDRVSIEAVHWAKGEVVVRHVHETVEQQGVLTDRVVEEHGLREVQLSR